MRITHATYRAFSGVVQRWHLHFQVGGLGTFGWKSMDFFAQMSCWKHRIFLWVFLLIGSKLFQALFLAFTSMQPTKKIESSIQVLPSLIGIRVHSLSMVMVNHEKQPFILSWQGPTGSWDLLRYIKQLSRDSPPLNGHNKHTKHRCFHLPATPTDVHSRCNLKAKKLDRFWWLWIFHHRFSGQVMWDGWMDVRKTTRISIVCRWIVFFGGGCPKELVVNGD